MSIQYTAPGFEPMNCEHESSPTRPWLPLRAEKFRVANIIQICTKRRLKKLWYYIFSQLELPSAILSAIKGPILKISQRHLKVQFEREKVPRNCHFIQR